MIEGCGEGKREREMGSESGIWRESGREGKDDADCNSRRKAENRIIQH